MQRTAREVIERSQPKIRLGERWKPGPIHRCDSEAGTYEMINAPMLGVVEATTQRAMLLRFPWTDPWTMRARRAVRKGWRADPYEALSDTEFICGVRRPLPFQEQP